MKLGDKVTVQPTIEEDFLWLMDIIGTVIDLTPGLSNSIIVQFPDGYGEWGFDESELRLLTYQKKPAFTIILPHRINAGNNAALAICLDCLAQNTHSEYALVIDAAIDEPLYPRVNRMIEHAYTDCVVYMASDMFLAKDWDVPMLEAFMPDLIITNVVVEPGAIAMHGQNLHKDFGRKPDSFRREQFEAWAASDAELLGGEGWYCPYMISRHEFLSMGGLRTDEAPDAMGFSGGDLAFFENWKASGRSIKRVKSFVYHLQRWSDEGEQAHEKRG